MEQTAADIAPAAEAARGVDGDELPPEPDQSSGQPWVGDPPDWMADAIWYQVFVSRFRNGDPANDPPNAIAWDDPWFERRAGEDGPLRRHLNHRTYGGDLAGVIASIDHFKSLGVNALYLNPVFEARSQHKYDTTDHRHVDPTYGAFDAENNRDGETLDPATWRRTAADRVLLDLIRKCHEADIRVVLDGVFNHVGRDFFAWRDVLENGPNSVYADWFDVTDWGPPIKYKAWDGPNGHLPEFRRDGGGLHPDVEAYVFNVLGRWTDPDGDGDPSDGVDGWRLDVAEKPPHGFWRRFRQRVKTINPNAAIVGEIWPNAQAWLGGDQFDSVTNYPFQTSVIRLIGKSSPAYSPRRFARQTDKQLADHRPSVNRAMMNLLDSHDTGRAVTLLAMDTHVEGALAMARPEASSFDSLRLAAMIQFTSVGAPMIYYGDEIGMYGGNDPFCRAPMWWTGPAAGGDPVLLEFFQKLGRLRRASAALRQGSFHWVLVDDRANVLAFERSFGSERLIVAINVAETKRTFSLNIGPVDRCEKVLTTDISVDAASGSAGFAVSGELLKGTLGPRSAGVFRVR